MDASYVLRNSTDLPGSSHVSTVVVMFGAELRQRIEITNRFMIVSR